MAKVDTTKLHDFASMLEKSVEAGLFAGALVVEAHAKKDAPVDTGRLRASISIRVIPKERKALIGTNVSYARKMEYGGSKKAPKGYLRKALKENEDKVKQAVAFYIKKAVPK